MVEPLEDLSDEKRKEGKCQEGKLVNIKKNLEITVEVKNQFEIMF